MTAPLRESTPEVLARQRALKVLGGLVLVAVLVSLLVFALGRSGSSKNNASADSPDTSGPAVVIATPAVPAASSSASGVSEAPSPSPTPAGTTAPAGVASCPTATPCVLDGDPGQASDAINAFRASHGLAGVTTTFDPADGACALASGSGASCTGGYFWEPVAALQGTLLVTKIASKSSGSTWLLDPQATAFTVGWCYSPGPAGKAGQVAGVIRKVAG